MNFFRHVFLLVCLILTPLQPLTAAPSCMQAPQPVLLGWLEDHRARSLEQVLVLPPEAWFSTSDTFPAFTRASVWLRLRLDNRGHDTCFYWLTLGAPRLESLQVYLPRQQHWERLQAGSQYPLSEWPSASRQPRFPIQLDTNQEMDILVRLDTRSRLYVSPHLWSQNALHTSMQEQQLLDGLAMGATFLILPFALVMAALYRDVLVLSNTLVLLFYFLLTLVVNGYLFYLPPLLPWSREYVALLSATAFVCLFAYIGLLFRIRQLPAWTGFLLWSYVLAGTVLLAWGAIGDFVATRQLFIHYRQASYVIYPLLMTLAFVHRVRLSWLAWAFGSFMTLQGLSLLLSGDFYTLVSYGEDDLAVTSNLPIILLLISTLIVTSQQHYRRELQLKRRVHMLQELARKKLKRTAEQRTRQLQESLRANQNLIARISHDLRAPLGHIITHAQRMQPENASAEARRIGHYAQRQLELLNELMAFALGDLQQQALTPTAGYLYSFVHDIAREGELLAERNNNRFRLQLDDELPPLVQADFRALRRILINLLDNACKYTHGGSICLSIQPGHRTARDVCLLFSIKDTGPGLAPELRQRILQPLERGNQAVAGFGLGLTIVAELLAQMQSELEIVQPDGGGSCFGFTLKLQLAQEHQIDQVFIENHTALLDAGHLCLLLVDDVRQTRDDLHELLGGYGFDILKAENGKEALALLATHDVDLVVTDQMMPEMDGLQLLSAIRAHYPGVQVLLYSAAPPLAQRDNPAPDFDGHLLKPANSDDILVTIHRLCHGKRQENQTIDVPEHQSECARTAL